jgi:putative serine/threonine protein kinase
LAKSLFALNPYLTANNMPKNMTPATIPTTQLDVEPYASVVCYPHANAREIAERISELQQHGVLAVEFSGYAGASNVPILGKGYVGIVVIAYVNEKCLALKMRRLDADRVDLMHEAELLKIANGVGVGPKFFAVSKNFLFSELIDGGSLINWLHSQGKEGVRSIVLNILEQCWRLDEAGVDHGELSKAPKHILVNSAGKPFIVDFETASITRRVINVTSVCQFLFQGNSEVCKAVASVIGERDRTKLVEALRHYKKERNRVNFERVLNICLS